MIALNATIEPGKAAAGLSIGGPLPAAVGYTRTQLEDGGDLLDFGPVCVWIKNGVVDQIAVRRGYSGHIQGTTIGIGSSIQEVQVMLGTLVEDDGDNLIVAQVPGLCFETEAWRGEPGKETIEDNLDAKLTEIFVFLSHDS